MVALGPRLSLRLKIQSRLIIIQSSKDLNFNGHGRVFDKSLVVSLDYYCK